MFFCEFCKIFKNIFRPNISGWLLLKFISEFWKVFQNTPFIEHLWETAYLMYKLQNFNQQIQWKKGAFQALYTATRSSHSKVFI